MAGVVLVHGAWHGAWCWDGVVGELAAVDAPVTAVELPLTGIDDDVAATRRVISNMGDDVVVLGHSYGGLVISEAASGMLEVSHLVYLAALMLDSGEDMIELMAEHHSEMLGIGLPEGTGVVVDRARAPELLYGDSDEAVVASVLPLLRPMHFRGELRVDRRPAWHDTASTYVVCSNDRAIPPSLQRQMAARAGAVVEWPTDHSPFLTRPRAIADLVEARLAS
ncbi:MAG: alpha/beta fold hydrolase [Acidimicrobiales bacterium]|jgi:pimeloyl-ACP methyl ester carboxylesterase